MSSLKLFLLGSPRLERDGAPLEFSMRKNLALIAYLAVTAQPHTREALVTLLWPELEPSRARAGLRRNLSMLKSALAGEWLVVERETVGADPDSDLWLDVRQFRALLQSCQEHGHPQEQVCPDCLSALAEAIELYQGDFMAGFSLRDSADFDEWQFFQAESLRQELALALETLARGHSAQGEHQVAIPYARRWLALDPLHEPAQRCLMRLYAWSGQRAAALRQYAECQRVLGEELGAPPEEETTQLYQAIKEKREPPPPETRTIAPVSAQTPGRKHNLPVQLTPFVGRETTLAEIRERLDDPACRLLTLVGPGGSGKTRLALQTAERLVQERTRPYAHGVFFVSLAPLDAVEAIAPTIAQALSYSFYQAVEAQQQLLDYLRQKEILLILDNLEHLLPGVDLLTEILKIAPGIKILATSRTSLNLDGEHLYRVAGMEYPQGAQQPENALQYSAVKLFLQAARRAQPDFELTDKNLGDVVQICRMVGGMPLGIRLAAAWAEMLTPAEIATEMHRDLDFLETDQRDVPRQQRSLRAVFDHSWRLLTDQQQEIFQGLSVFRGGFTDQAAQQVTGATLRQLMALINKSLLQREPTGRYQVHELSRQFAADKLRRAEKLAQSPTARETAHEQHSAYYAAALQEWAADLKGPRQQTALAEMDAEIENARAAWNWALGQGAVQRLEQAMEGLCLFYTRRGRYREGRAACQAAAEKLLEAPGVQAQALAWQGAFNQELGRV
jgi:predicted ATPase